MKISQSVAAIAAISMLTACTEPNGAPGKGVENGGSPSGKDVGTAAGAVAGGVIGYQFGAGWGAAAMTAGGALLGGYLGDLVGSAFDEKAMANYDQASQKAMNSGESTKWQNGDTHGTVSPHKRYKNDDGQYCREYTQSIWVDGEKHTGHGTACKGDDGVWRIVE